jgi:hypothetical protein
MFKTFGPKRSEPSHWSVERQIMNKKHIQSFVATVCLGCLASASALAQPTNQFLSPGQDAGFFSKERPQNCINTMGHEANSGEMAIL